MTPRTGGRKRYMMQHKPCHSSDHPALKILSSGGPQGQQRSQDFEVTEVCCLPISDSALETGHFRQDSSKMEKDGRLHKEHSHSLKSAQSSNTRELRNSYESSAMSTTRNRESNSVQVRMISPQPYVGHVKGLRKVFEDIGQREEAPQQWEKLRIKPFGSLREKPPQVKRVPLNTPGVHEPVYSQVFNPVRAKSLERKAECGKISVRPTSPILNMVISSRNWDKNWSNETPTEISPKNVEIFGRSRRERDAHRRQIRSTQQDIIVPPRVPTPPLERARDNISISLRSPKGWRKYEESHVAQSPKDLRVLKDTAASVETHSSDTFFFSGQLDQKHITDVGKPSLKDNVILITEPHEKSKEQYESSSETSLLQNKKPFSSSEETEINISERSIERYSIPLNLKDAQWEIDKSVDSEPVKGLKHKRVTIPFSESLLVENKGDEGSSKITVTVRPAEQKSNKSNLQDIKEAVKHQKEPPEKSNKEFEGTSMFDENSLIGSTWEKTSLFERNVENERDSVPLFINDIRWEKEHSGNPEPVKEHKHKIADNAFSECLLNADNANNGSNAVIVIVRRAEQGIPGPETKAPTKMPLQKHDSPLSKEKDSTFVKQTIEGERVSVPLLLKNVNWENEHPVDSEPVKGLKYKVDNDNESSSKVIVKVISAETNLPVQEAKESFQNQKEPPKTNSEQIELMSKLDGNHCIKSHKSTRTMESERTTVPLHLKDNQGDSAPVKGLKHKAVNIAFSKSLFGEDNDDDEEKSKVIVKVISGEQKKEEAKEKNENNKGLSKSIREQVKLISRLDEKSCINSDNTTRAIESERDTVCLILKDSHLLNDTPMDSAPIKGLKHKTFDDDFSDGLVNKERKESSRVVISMRSGEQGTFENGSNVLAQNQTGLTEQNKELLERSSKLNVLQNETSLISSREIERTLYERPIASKRDSDPLMLKDVYWENKQRVDSDSVEGLKHTKLDVKLSQSLLGEQKEHEDSSKVVVMVVRPGERVQKELFEINSVEIPVINSFSTSRLSETTVESNKHAVPLLLKDVRWEIEKSVDSQPVKGLKHKTADVDLSESLLGEDKENEESTRVLVTVRAAEEANSDNCTTTPLGNDIGITEKNNEPLGGYSKLSILQDERPLISSADRDRLLLEQVMESDHVPLLLKDVHWENVEHMDSESVKSLKHKTKDIKLSELLSGDHKEKEDSSKNVATERSAEPNINLQEIMEPDKNLKEPPEKCKEKEFEITEFNENYRMSSVKTEPLLERKVERHVESVPLLLKDVRWDNEQHVDLQPIKGLKYKKADADFSESQLRENKENEEITMVLDISTTTEQSDSEKHTKIPLQSQIGIKEKHDEPLERSSKLSLIQDGSPFISSLDRDMHLFELMMENDRKLKEGLNHKAMDIKISENLLGEQKEEISKEIEIVRSEEHNITLQGLMEPTQNQKEPPKKSTEFKRTEFNENYLIGSVELGTPLERHMERDVEAVPLLLKNIWWENEQHVDSQPIKGLKHKKVDVSFSNTLTGEHSNEGKNKCIVTVSAGEQEVHENRTNISEFIVIQHEKDIACIPSETETCKEEVTGSSKEIIKDVGQMILEITENTTMRKEVCITGEDKENNSSCTTSSNDLEKIIDKPFNILTNKIDEVWHASHSDFIIQKNAANNSEMESVVVSANHSLPMEELSQKEEAGDITYGGMPAGGEQNMQIIKETDITQLPSEDLSGKNQDFTHMIQTLNSNTISQPDKELREGTGIVDKTSEEIVQTKDIVNQVGNMIAKNGECVKIMPIEEEQEKSTSKWQPNILDQAQIFNIDQDEYRVDKTRCINGHITDVVTVPTGSSEDCSDQTDGNVNLNVYDIIIDQMSLAMNKKESMMTQSTESSEKTSDDSYGEVIMETGDMVQTKDSTEHTEEAEGNGNYKLASDANINHTGELTVQPLDTMNVSTLNASDQLTRNLMAQYTEVKKQAENMIVILSTIDKPENTIEDSAKKAIDITDTNRDVITKYTDSTDQKKNVGNFALDVVDCAEDVIVHEYTKHETTDNINGNTASQIQNNNLIQKQIPDSLINTNDLQKNTGERDMESVVNDAWSKPQGELTFQQTTHSSIQLPKVSSVDQGSTLNEVTAKVTGEKVPHVEVEEERESPEDMNVWVNTLRQLETPEIMKYQRVPRQPRSSPLNMYATLSPIKEDIGSPKTDINSPNLFTKQTNNMEMSPLQKTSNQNTETENKQDQSEKILFSWEREASKLSDKSSPLEMMRKHSGEETARSAAYKTLINQNLSQRQSSIIGSLLLSDRLSESKSEGKPYSRLDSSLLLSSYMRPKKDSQQMSPVEVPAPSQNTLVKAGDHPSLDNNPSLDTNKDSETSPPKNEEDLAPAQPSNHHSKKESTPVASPFKAFPEVWINTGKHHGKVNPRPGKIILFSEAGYRGKKYETSSDITNTTRWELQESISVCVIRGGWLLYEKPQFQGRRVMLCEGDIELTCPWSNPKKQEKDSQDREKESKFWVGSLRHVVRDFQVPEISLFSEENGEGRKVKYVGAMPDIREHEQPVRAVSIIVHSGMWLVYGQPSFEGDPYILERGGYPTMKAWGGQDPNLCSLQPALIGGPTVEKPNEPKLLLFQLPNFQGPCWQVTRDLHSLQHETNSEGQSLTSVGSLQVLGGCWVGYEKEGFRGHQYLLEEGDYRDWSYWGGCTEELGSIRLIRTDFSEPEIILYEKPGCTEGPCLRLSEALADMEEAHYGTNTGSIDVLSGVWVAYENVDFSGEQYILEKGTYHNHPDWGAKNTQISSLQPVVQVGGHSLHFVSKIHLFSEENFQGEYLTSEEDRVLLPDSFTPKSCRVEGGSWSLYEGENCSGEQYILSEGDYPTRTAMGCLTFCTLRSARKVPLYFSVPSISLHGLERFEGKELEFSGEVRSLQGEGYNNHVLSVKVGSGIWVLYEHSDFRGRQWLLEPTEIPNWLLYSGHQRIGSLCPIRQRRVYFRLRNRSLGLYLCVPEPTEDMKAARVLISEPRDGSCDMWYYEEGRIKNQLTPQMSLQVIGQPCSGTKVVMWSDGRKPLQTWFLDDSGYITNLTFKGLCLDLKGGHSYDSDHVVVWNTTEDRLTQHWDLEVF
ncbi:beta/gamma crystallin domain-containing protein 2 isoform X2 [Bombina bombina]|uniref:beta/gamma crystallin domain-containing protein 2 isoform X2 n=1 Tax=Bombina bombina TaxID=8345 RepID=UPI00235A51DE|nr:beta/gamma crystallin domain-containing protein 2 isoform X2 [Bombina bombina]